MMEFEREFERGRLPVIDLTSEEMRPGTHTWAHACEVVRRALEDHGAFLALFDYHKLDDSIFTSAHQLFHLPTPTKTQLTSDKPFHGHFAMLPSAPHFESLAIDNPLAIQHCHNFTHLMWPAGNNSFCESANAYAKGLAELDRVAKRMVFESYGVGRDKCEALLDSTNYVMRYYKYNVPKEGDTFLGLATHTDTTFFTVLRQYTKGLEIQDKHGHWIEVDHPSPSMFCLIAGDAFQVWSNDRIRACRHRVMIKSKTTARYSMGLLSYAAKTLYPAEELVDEDHPLRYKPLNHYQYLPFIATEEALKAESRIKLYCGI